MAAVSRDFLAFQSARLERWLALHRIPVRVDRALVVDGWIRFEMTSASGVDLPTLWNMRGEIASALGSADAHVTETDSAFALEVPRPDSEPVTLLGLLAQLTDIPLLSACVGLAHDGRPLLIRLPSDEVGNVLITGGEGTGKTELMRALLLSLALTHRQSQVQMALFDSRRGGLAPLRELPHLLTPVAASPAGAEALLARLLAEVERREEARVNSPHIIAAIDDFPELLNLSGREAKTHLAQLVQRGRPAGVSLIVGARPSPGLGALPRADFPVRLVGRVASSDEAREASGIGNSGAEFLAGHGSFVAVANGQPIPFRIAWVPPHEWASALARIGNPVMSSAPEA